jgi:type I restriction enzyme R subunit
LDSGAHRAVPAGKEREDAGWQQTSAGEREVKKALRKTLLKYQLHQDDSLFEKAYGYIKQYY